MYCDLPIVLSSVLFWFYIDSVKLFSNERIINSALIHAFVSGIGNNVIIFMYPSIVYDYNEVKDQIPTLISFISFGYGFYDIYLGIRSKKIDNIFHGFIFVSSFCSTYYVGIMSVMPLFMITETSSIFLNLRPYSMRWIDITCFLTFFVYRILVCPTFVILYVINSANSIRGLILVGGLCITGLNLYWFILHSNKIKLLINVYPNLVSEFPKPFEMTKWLCFSSCFFLVPGVYAFYNKQHFYGTVCVYTFIFSVNHWRKAKDGIRRKMDIIAASSGALIYIISWIVYCEGTCFLMGIPTLILVVASILLSNYLSIRWNPYWVYIHMFFHMAVSISKMLVIHCKSRNNITNLYK
jgi:hypothetical protein